jgi:serine protease inhibitor ecotin
MAGWLIKNLIEYLLPSFRRNLFSNFKRCFHDRHRFSGVKKAFEVRHVRNGLLFVTIIAASLASAQVFSTQQQALERAFPKPQIVGRQTLFLDDKQVESIQKQARAKLESKIVTYYLGKDGDKITGYAFFATDIVRTKAATYMAVVNPDSTVRFVEVLAFYEPMDYFPMARWLDLFRGKLLNDNLWPRRDIHNITGATLTTQAITQGARKMLAIFQVAVPKHDNP